MSRTDELLKAVDDLIREHDRWENDRTASMSLMDSTCRIGQHIEQLADVFDAGDVPHRCLGLHNAVKELRLQWDMYASEVHVRSDGGPYQAFWSAYRAVVTERVGVRVVAPRITEPVKTLVAQGVSHRQIAYVIYGHSGEGPFLENGQIRADLIEQEAKEPGSVLGTDWQRWIHPREIERCQVEEQRQSERLQKAEEKVNQSRDNSGAGDSGSGDGTIADVILRLHESNRDADASELAKAVREETGQKVTVKDVADILREAKKVQTAGA